MYDDDQSAAVCTLCSWQETNVWNPGATPNPSWSMKDGSSWLWIWTLTPASNDVSSARCQSMWHQSNTLWKWVRHLELVLSLSFTLCSITPPTHTHYKKVTDNHICQTLIEVNNVPLTCFSPDRQVFILLNVQHELQSITHTSLGGDQGRASIIAGIKGVTLPVAREHLRDT